MPIKAFVKTNIYKDSVALMRTAQLVVAQTGVRRATLLMGTSGNKNLLSQAGLLVSATQNAQPNDIMVVIEADSEDAAEAAISQVHALIEGEEPRKAGGATTDAPPRSIAAGIALSPDANLAQISVPGPYAGAEALKALHQGLNVFLFSDNVPLEQERVIKDLARRKELLVMGPDCGTAIIRGVPLGFANVVRRGPIGLVGASGTGLQEVTCRIHQLGGGVSHAIGTGSRDISEAIGGSTMSQALQLLAADPDTKIIAIVSKPPAASVQKRITREVESIGKPVVICFLGAAAGDTAGTSSIHSAATLYDTATKAVALQSGNPATTGTAVPPMKAITDERFPAPDQRFVRGLFSGGTFCYEAQIIWRQHGIRSFSNAPLEAGDRLSEGSASREHCAIDLGSDEFTVGRPHPMIDPSLRIERLLQEAHDPSVAVILLDVVLGYGSHENPAGVLAPAIAQAKSVAARQGRYLPIICFVCGTDEDPQVLSSQEAALRREGVLLAPSSTAAAELAVRIVHQAAMAAPRAAQSPANSKSSG
ncbi:MAG: acyl-CoA synthetase FdrA [Hyphomicrobiales bacterium]|nr:acyl-CoA synthetase FdrA [Hyphomicrobiales bacterium]